MWRRELSRLGIAIMLGVLLAGGLLASSLWAERAAAPVEVRFGSEVVAGVPVTVEPLDPLIEVTELGRAYRTTYRVTNRSDETITVLPVRSVEATGTRDAFLMVRCFCWLSHELRPREVIDLPVWFIIGNGWLGQHPGHFDVRWTFYQSEDGVGTIPEDQVLDPAVHPTEEESHDH